LKEAAEILRTAWDLYKSGDRDLQSYLDALSNYNDVAWMYRDALVRHRRAMLRLNTVVGRRVVP
jgi:cobalt-zinc-cadmium efflux system outer membrane protein